MEQNKRRRFKLFDTQREGKGVEKGEEYTKTDLKGFFIKYKRCFTRLLSVNLLMIFGNFPLIFALIAMLPITRIAYLTPAQASFPVLRGLFLAGGELSASTLVTVGLEGVQITTYAMTATTYIFFALAALVLFTFGPVNAGITYVLRGLVRGDAVFTWSDFFYAIRRNWKQALPFGILDAIFVVLIPFDLYYALTSLQGVFGGIIIGLTGAIGILYLWMRYYIYLQMITFDLPMKKILKNSFLFTMLGFKRNLVATVGILLLILLNLMLALGFGGILASLAILFPLFILFSNGAFMTTYAAYFKIKEIMIDPYGSEEPAEEPIEEDLLPDGEEGEGAET